MVTDARNDHEKKAEKAAVLLTLAGETGQAAGPCLTAEEMAALVDGRVKDRESAVYLAHLADCRKCYEEWLFLKKDRNLGAHRGRVYALRRVKKFSYIGSALAVAASIAVYLNVGNMADKVMDQAVPDTALMQDKAVVPAPQRQTAENKERDEPPPAAGQNGAVLSAMPAAPAIVDGPAKSRLEVAPAGAENPQEQRAKRLAAPLPAAVPAQPESKVAREAASTPVERSSAPAASPGDAEVAEWLEQLREACLSDRHGAEFWAEMSDRGERLRVARSASLAEEQRQRLTALLALVQGMSGPASQSGQCRLIQAELAKDGGTR